MQVKSLEAFWIHSKPPMNAIHYCKWNPHITTIYNFKIWLKVFVRQIILKQNTNTIIMKQFRVCSVYCSFPAITSNCSFAHQQVINHLSIYCYFTKALMPLPHWPLAYRSMQSMVKCFSVKLSKWQLAPYSSLIMKT